MESKLEEERSKWIDSPYNTFYSNNLGKVFRSFPCSKTEVELFDIISMASFKVTILELKIWINDGSLTEFDPHVNHTLLSGTRKTKPTTPEKESSLIGKYSTPTLTNKYKSKPAGTPRDSSFNDEGSTPVGTDIVRTVPGESSGVPRSAPPATTGAVSSVRKYRLKTDN